MVTLLRIGKYKLDSNKRINFGLHVWFSKPSLVKTFPLPPGGTKHPFAFAGISLGWISFALVVLP